MPDLIRFGISLPSTLLKEFDRYIKSENYTNRSEAIRDLIRDAMIKDEWENSDRDVAGAIIFVYDHHVRELMEKLTNIQHDHYRLIVSSQHVHLDHHNCLEIVVVKGPSKEIRELYTQIKSIKNVKHTQLSMSSTGKHIA
jgi:CopG family transcriptional regulator, nickel-responsive regulator